MTSRALCGNPDAEIDYEFVKMLSQEDPKTAINRFCQRYCNRPISKEDLSFAVEKYPSGYQAILTLHCIGDKEFAGEVSPSAKDAINQASRQALDHYAEAIATMEPKQKKRKKRPAGPPPPKDPAKIPKPGDPPPELDPNLSAKAHLHATVGKILRRVMEKDVVYESQRVVGGYQATVQMPGLEGEWGERIWAGEVYPRRQEAEQSAAQLALLAVREDQELMIRHNQPPKERYTPPSRGQALGKGSKPPGAVFEGKAYWVTPEHWKRTGRRTG